MKYLIYLIAIMSFNCIADISATMGTGVAEQLYKGSQPNDRASSHIDLNVFIDATSNIDGIQSVIGYEFQCEGDPFPNKAQQIDSTSSKALNLKFTQVTPLYFAQWASDGSVHNCHMTWSVASVGTRTSSGVLVTFSLSGVFGGINLELTNTLISSEFRKGSANSSLFTVIKEPNCI